MTDFPRSLLEFQQRFPDEEACAAYLAILRWPAGFVCPACGSSRGWALATKAYTHECADCRKQTSVTAGTVMHGSKLALIAWFWAAYLMATHSNGISALQLQKQLGLGSYKTAWLLATKLRRAMVAPERMPLAGLVEVDESLIACRSKDDPPSGGGRRSHQGKLLVAGAVEVGEGGPGRIRLARIEDFSADSLHAFLGANLAPGATARTDGWAGYPGASGITHDPHVVGNMAAHMVLPWVHRRLRQPQDLGAGRLPRPPTPTPAILPRRVRLPLQPAPNPPRSLPLHPRHRRRNQAGYLQDVDRTGATGISLTGQIPTKIPHRSA